MPSGVYIRKSFSKTHKENLRLAMKKRKLSKKHCENIGKSKMGNENCKGKHWKLSEITKLKQGIAKIGNKNFGERDCRGKNNGFYGKHHSKKTKEKQRIATIKMLQTHKGNFKDTNIERKIEKHLDKLIKFKIISNYIKQFSIKKYIVDFFIPELNLVIECNGEYFHSGFAKKYKDMKRKERIQKLGYKIRIFWGKEIMAKDFNLEKLLNKIGELKC